MDEKSLVENLAEELIKGWDITPTGSGFLISTDWRWPNHERIEVYVRTVGEREDLYLVSDGGEVFNFLFAQGIDLAKDSQGMKIFSGVAQNYGAKIVDYQMAKGASDADLPQAVRAILEAIKDVSFLLWHKLGHDSETFSTH
jgi:hypothetical protein